MNQAWKWAAGILVAIFVFGGMYLSGCGGNINPLHWTVSWYAFATGPSEYLRELHNLCSFKPVTREDVMGEKDPPAPLPSVNPWD